MKFTWLTYEIAIKRAFDREYELFSGPISTTGAWVKAMNLTNALRRRRVRERGKR